MWGNVQVSNKIVTFIICFTGFMMSMHSVDADELPAVSASQIDFQTVLASTAVTVPTSKFTLVKIHGK